MSKFYDKFSCFLNKNRETLRYKILPYLKHESINDHQEGFLISGCLYFDFYFEGDIYTTGIFVDILVDHNKKEILTLKIAENEKAFLKDQSSENLKDQELKILTEKFFDPMLKNYLKNDQDLLLKEQILESISDGTLLRNRKIEK